MASSVSSWFYVQTLLAVYSVVQVQSAVDAAQVIQTIRVLNYPRLQSVWFFKVTVGYYSS